MVAFPVSLQIIAGLSYFVLLIYYRSEDVVVEIDGVELHPLLAYLGYQGSGLQAVTSHDPEGTLMKALSRFYLHHFVKRRY